jgi:phosphotransferase system enzyme I (PtsP)
MLETPSLAWQINAICDHADFVSVGCNDLLQFFFAADRDNPRVADRYDPLHPAALSIMRFIAYHCTKNNVPVSVCGGIAGRPLEACVLAALGYETLSMPMNGIGPVKAALLNLDADAMWEFVQPLITVESRKSSIREELVAWCAEQGVPV